MSKGRMEAFSDGVLAIIITIMVLNLPLPHGLYTKPIVIMNINNYYAPLIEMLEKSIRENFMSESHRKMWTVVSDPDDIMSAIENSPDWSADAISFAAVK